VGVDGHPADIAHLRHHAGDGFLHEHRQHGAVGVTQHHGLGPRRGGRAQAFERVVRMGLVRVEEVLRVVVDDLAPFMQETHRIGDHP